MPHGALPPAVTGNSHGSRATRDAAEPVDEQRASTSGRRIAGTVKIHVTDYARTTLKPRHRLVVRALAESLFDHDRAIPIARLDGFAEEVDRFISPASKTLRFGLLLMLDVIRLAPLFVIGRFALFEDVPLEPRIEMLRRLERSKLAPLTLILVAYKTILTLLFFENENELMATGYTGPDRVRWLKKGLPMLNDSPNRPPPIASVE